MNAFIHSLSKKYKCRASKYTVLLLIQFFIVYFMAHFNVVFPMVSLDLFSYF